MSPSYFLSQVHQRDPKFIDRDTHRWAQTPEPSPEQKKARIHQGSRRFFSAVLRSVTYRHEPFEQNSGELPTARRWHLSKPTGLHLRRYTDGWANDFPFAQYPESVDSSATLVDTTPNLIRCGNLVYKASWHTDLDGKVRIDYDDAQNLSYNRALFVDHTTKLVARGGMQASRPHLYAAADLYQCNIMIWSCNGRTSNLWSVIERIEPCAGAALHTVNLGLYMKSGDASHYRVLDNLLGLKSEFGVVVSCQATAIEVGGEGECLYLALAYALDRPDVRAIRAEYGNLKNRGYRTSGFAGFINRRIGVLTQMHAELGQALGAPEYAERIDAEVQDTIAQQLRYQCLR